MRSLKYCVDCSLDGFIAREDHSYGFLIREGEHFDDFLDSLKTFDIALMGKNTYEVGLKDGAIDPSLNLQQFVISSSLENTVDERIKIISKNALKFVGRLKQEKGNDILLSGGSILATNLLNENLVDEIQLRIHPVIIGSGIPFFGNHHNTLALQVRNQRLYSNNVMLLAYDVKH
jgi:dihydrofolate reductase